MNILFQKLNALAQTPTYATEGDFGCDVVATSEEEVAPNVWKYCLGFRYEMDRKSLERSIRKLVGFNPFRRKIDLEDWIISIEARPKSGIWEHGMVLSNCVGTLDEFYRGEVCAVFYHTMPDMPRYKTGDAVVQLMISIAPKIKWIEKDHISTNTTRGTHGYGKQDEINRLKNINK